jgi:hypothetical protein
MRICSCLLAAILLACTMLGCGNRGASRFDVSGKVTFQGKLVPAGKILFLPDTEKGNSGPAGAAEIRDGVYNTAKKGKGTSGGPQLVVISGYDGKAVPGDEMNIGKQLFPEYRTSVDLPRETTTKDFDVPAARR